MRRTADGALHYIITAAAAPSVDHIQQPTTSALPSPTDLTGYRPACEPGKQPATERTRTNEHDRSLRTTYLRT
jgi:hypothetical protein